MKLLRELFLYGVLAAFSILFAIGVTSHAYGKVKNEGIENLNFIEKLFYYTGVFISFNIENSDQITFSEKKRAVARQLYFDLPMLETTDWQNFKNNFKLDRNILVSFFDVPNSKWNAFLLNLSTQDTLHSWSVDDDFIQQQTRTKDLHQSRLKHPIMLKDTSLVFEMHEEEALYCLDKNSNLIWKTKINAHHAINLDAKENLWFCSGKDTVLQENIFDEYLVQIDSKGKILKKVSLYQVMKTNGFYDLIVSNAINEQNVFHLNDIQPVLEDSQYWRKGDLFVSLRNLNMVLLYRPSNDSVLWHSFGPWHGQHDVDIVSDSIIYVFNNNRVRLKQEKFHKAVIEEKSNIISYNFADDSFETLLTNYAEQNDLYTQIEGSQELVNDSILIIEETMKGRYHIVNLKNTNENEFLSFTQYLDEDRLYPRMNWFRVY